MRRDIEKFEPTIEKEEEEGAYRERGEGKEEKKEEVAKEPYQEQKEEWGEKKFDSIVVFGQGPVKPVLLLEELTPGQRKNWEEFKKEPLRQTEPDFRVVEGRAYLSELAEIDKRENLTDEEKEQLKELKRQDWQRMGRFALNRWGRQNALAAGLALHLGITNELVLSGGRTISRWAKETLPQERTKNWPSEAELMKDIIIRHFGELYEKKYGRPIEEAIKIEDTSTNTLENFAYTINNNPELFSKENKVGLLATDFHIRRVALIARVFSVREAPRGKISAQEILRKRAMIRKKEKYKGMLDYMRDALSNPDLRKRLRGEERWERGLIDPDYLAYWVGYIGEVKNPIIIQKVMSKLKNPDWVEAAKRAFGKVGLNFDDFSEKDLIELQKNNPEDYEHLREGLKKLTTPEYRAVPPSV